MNGIETPASTCRHCAVPVKWMAYPMRPRWMHMRPGTTSFGAYEHCKQQVAEPGNDAR